MTGESPSSAGMDAFDASGPLLPPVEISTVQIAVSEPGDATGTGEDQVLDEEERVLRAVPPWLGSLVIHLALLVTAGLLVYQSPLRKDTQFDAVFADREGDQLDNDLLELSTLEETVDAKEPVFVPDESIPVEDPLAAPPDLPVTLDRGLLTGDMEAPTIGLALQGREEGYKQVLLKSYGGNARTIEAVKLALEWLKRNQRRNGSWSLTGPYADGANMENLPAATAMALLAFQGDGHTHQRGKYQKVVANGMAFLLKQQNRAGSFFRSGDSHHRPYTQAMATIAVCELYAMTRDEELREPAQRAVDYAVKIQDAEGGWRYEPKRESDTSVTGWYLMALQSARMGGLEVPSSVFDNVSRYLDLAATEEGARYSYLPGNYETPSMTAEGLLCRQYLGWRREDERMRLGVAYIMENPMDWSDRNTYYWYYATQLLHNMEGYEWEEWNRVMKELLPKNQEQKGDERGSWSRVGDRWGAYGGRLFVTCLSTYMLEVYYRHLPIYSPLYRESKGGSR